MAQSEALSGDAPAGLPASLSAQQCTVSEAYSLSARVTVLLLASLVGVVIAGFWNFRLVDGFGREVVAGQTLGDPGELGGTFASHGFGFGFLFAAIAGLAATFTACNCVVFAMLPGLVAGGSAGSRRAALSALGVFTAGVLAVGAIYGFFIGSLGPDGIEAFNSRAIRFAQAGTVYTIIGTLMMVWGALELGLLEPVRRRLASETRAFWARPTSRAALLGGLVGAFAIGRPFPVMRDFLEYAAAANSPVYGAAVMMVQGLGQIAVMVVLLLAIVYGLGGLLTRWVSTRPHQVTLVTAVALAAGGAFFVFYWGLARAFDIGRWGARLGWY